MSTSRQGAKTQSHWRKVTSSYCQTLGSAGKIEVGDFAFEGTIGSWRNLAWLNHLARGRPAYAHARYLLNIG